ncbi:MAG: methionine synthase [Rikenellaceae bacterium]
MIREELEKRILVLDGAFGTMIQTYALTESDFRGERFAAWNIDLKGCNDILVFTAASIIKEIHTKYLNAGADIISTNSFNANSISMSEYGLEDNVYEMNYTAATLARKAISEGGFKGRYVAGSVGPTGRTASMSPSVEDAALRNVTFEELLFAYRSQIEGLVDGGADIILLETIFDTLNAKAAIMAHEYVCAMREKDIPLMVSGTITDNSGRTLSGQTVEAFVYSLSHSIHLLSVGLNCAFGAELIYPYLRRLEQVSSSFVSVHPNAGLPDAFGNYSHTAAKMGEIVEQFMREGLVNIVGGCCGTTPEHIAIIASLSKKYAPRKRREIDHTTTFTGLEPLRLTSNIGFINIGERANVAGSAKFARLIREGNYDEAVSVVLAQVQSGASVIDVCMDDAMIEAVPAMRHFLNLLASEPDIACKPIMIDSSKWEVLESGMQCVQGKSIVNSISLKEGEDKFLQRAMKIHLYGCAAVVMLFDEKGQADSYERKIEVASRAYNLLTTNGFPAEDIIFDPNVLTIGTGIVEHNNYAADFIRAVKYIKENLPHAKVSGGVSNLSFAFRGNNIVREAMHAAFLYHAIRAGMDMAIVNAANLLIYEDIDKTLLKHVEDLIFNTDSHATERLTDYAITLKSEGMHDKTESGSNALAWRDLPLDERITYWLVRGILDYVDQDINEALTYYKEAVKVIEQPLMNSMKQVGALFGEGKMFLPQVVKSARVMKRAVDILSPYISRTTATSAGKVVVATVKGDVHDIGKNIVSIVLSCNGFEVIDLGVMTPPETIVKAIRQHNPKIVCLSGLITPSLDEMASLLELFNHEGIKIPVLVGGATTSPLHTAVKLATKYNSVVAQTSDASSCAKLAVEITGSARDEIITSVMAMHEVLRAKYAAEQASKNDLTIDEARQKHAILDFSAIKKPNKLGKTIFDNVDFDRVEELINWTSFFAAWQIKGRIPQIFDHPEKGVEARKLYNDALAMLQKMRNIVKIKGVVALYDAESRDETITVADGNQHLALNVGRSVDRNATENLSLADFVAAKNDYVGFMTLSVFGAEELAASYADDSYSVLMAKLLCDRLVEAASEYLHFLVRTDLWGYSNEQFDRGRLLRGDYKGIRPAFGYPCLKDHSLKREVFNFIDVENIVGTHLTENFAMSPASSISAMIFANENSKYFIIK